MGCWVSSHVDERKGGHGYRGASVFCPKEGWGNSIDADTGWLMGWLSVRGDGSDAGHAPPQHTEPDGCVVLL